MPATLGDAMTAIEPCVGEQHFLCFNARDEGRLKISMEGTRLFVRGSNGFSELIVSCGSETSLTLVATSGLALHEIGDAILGAVEVLLAKSPQLERIRLNVEQAAPHSLAALQAGGVLISDGGDVWIQPELFFQVSAPWTPKAAPQPFPQFHIMTSGRRHPLRPPKPRGTVYARFIPWLNQVLSFRTVNIEHDLDRFHNWMNDPRVATIWDEQGTRDKHRAYLEANRADPHMLALFGCLDHVPFSYFEVYWAKENRLGPFYDADDYDRGWHVAVGEESFRGKAFVSAWLPSLMHFIFLDDPRTQRIVGEPAASHAQQLRNLERSGFAKIKHVDFPHKRAVLVMLLREKFFRDRLWVPAQSDEGASTRESASNQIQATGQLVQA
jgi:acetyl CoA:N6-hydroxylysine acetyl transferase